MINYNPKQLYIKIEQSSFIEYPEEWRDKTGPFGGAYNWALEHLADNEEVVGIRRKENHLGRVSIYRFRLAKGKNGYISGRMEYPNNRHYSLNNLVLHLIEVGNRITAEWIALDKGDGNIKWHQTFGIKIEKFNAPPFSPLDPYVAICELIREIERNKRNNGNVTETDWCQSVFGCRLKDISRHYYRLIFDPENLDNIQKTYNECMDIILTEGVTADTIDELIDIGLDLVNPISNNTNDYLPDEPGDLEEEDI